MFLFVCFLILRVWKEVGALERIEKQAGFVDFYHPAKTLRNFLSPLPAAEYGNLTAEGHFCNCRVQGSGWEEGPSILLLARALAPKEEDEMRLKMSLRFVTLMGFLLFPLSVVVQCCS